MTESDIVLTIEEVAELLRVNRAKVLALGRANVIKRVGTFRPPRYLRSSVEALIYHVPDAEPVGQTSAQAATPRRGDRRPPHGSLASEALGGGGALHRPIGTAPGDVVVRRVESRG